MSSRSLTLNFNGEEIYNVKLKRNEYANKLSLSILNIMDCFDDYELIKVNQDSGSGNVNSVAVYKNSVNGDDLIYTDNIKNEYLPDDEYTLDKMLAIPALKRSLRKVFTHDQFSEATFNQLVGA